MKFKKLFLIVALLGFLACSCSTTKTEVKQGKDPKIKQEQEVPN